MPATLKFDIDENVANITSTAMSSFSKFILRSPFQCIKYWLFNSLNFVYETTLLNLIKTSKGNHRRAIFLFQPMDKAFQSAVQSWRWYQGKS